ncbi:hypothetical protein M441DRAFT_155012, partial [Trichoderma asperellum CBS 433.97]
KLFTGIQYNSIFIVVCRLIKQAYFLLYKKLHLLKDLAYTYIKIIAANYRLPKEIILN